MLILAIRFIWFQIQMMAKLTRLTELWLSRNQITDVSPLATLTQLTTLYLDGNQITDFSALRSLEAGRLTIYGKKKQR